MRIWIPVAALFLPALLAGCPEKKSPAEPESANAALPASAQGPAPAAADTSGAPKQEEEDDEGGW